jgi:tetratricopeptide (TPR) repeat protein
MSEPETALAAETNPPGAMQAKAAPRKGRLARWWWAWSILGLALVAGGAVLATRIRWTPPSLDRAEKLLAEKRFAEAASEAEAVLETKPGDTRALFAAARARVGMEDWARAVAALESVPDWSARKTEALLLVAQIQKKRNRGRDAETNFRACLARDPDGPAGTSARIELMKLYAMEERVDEFKALVWDVLPRVSDLDKVMVLMRRMQIEFEQTLPEINAKTLRAMVGEDPEDAYARAGLAAALDRSGDVEQARKLYAHALAARPNDPELRERYLDLLQRLGDMTTLRAVLEARPPGTDERPATLKFLGIVAEADGKADQAIAYQERAVAADPTDPQHHHRLSLLLYRNRRKADAEREAAERTRLDKARDQLRQAWNAFATPFETDPTHVDPALLLGMARACEACGWVREASAWYRATLSKAPDDPQARAGLQRVEALPQR